MKLLSFYARIKHVQLSDRQRIISNTNLSFEVIAVLNLPHLFAPRPTSPCTLYNFQNGMKSSALKLEDAIYSTLLDDSLITLISQKAVDDVVAERF